MKVQEILWEDGKTVFRSQGAKCLEFVGVSSALEAEVLKYLKRRLLCETVYIHFP